MKVMVNARFYKLPFHQAKFRNLLEQLILLSRTVPLEWIYIFTDIPDAELIIQQNKHRFVSACNLEKVAEKKIGSISIKFWLDLRLKQLCKKHQADVLIHGDHFCSLNARIPQIIFTDGNLNEQIIKLPFWHRILFERRWNQTISKAWGFLFWSSLYREIFIRSFPVLASRSYTSALIPLASIQAISWEEKQEILNQYTQGVEFFIGIIEGAHAHDLFMDLLKGYSWFKKRFHSNMKIVVFGVHGQQWLKSVPLDSYKYRNDIILPDCKNYLEILPAGYAMVYMAYGKHIPMALFEALQVGVPVIATKDSVTEDLAGDAVAWKKDADPEQWGHLMGELYKDELFRNQLINRGFELSAKKLSDPEYHPFQEIFSKVTIRTFAAL